MRFHTEHAFTGSEQVVAALLSDPDFYLELTLPDLGQPEVLEQRQDVAASSLRLRYEFIGSIDPIARRLIGSDRLSWIQEVRVDRSAGSGALGFQAEKSPKQLHGAATFTLVPTGGGCVRSLDGELVVAVPGLGRMAERRIVPGVIRRLDIEAQAMNDRLA